MVIDIDQYPQQPKHNFEDFFKNYEDSPNHFKYREEIQSAALRKKFHVDVLFEDILSYDPPLAELLREAPEETLREGIEAFKDLLKFYSGGKIDEELDYFIRIKTDNNSNEVNLRKLRAAHIDKLVYIYGILIRASQIVPQITVAYFECPVCQQVTKVDQIENVLIVPKQCSNCKNKAGFIVTSKDSKFIDWQSIQIQELPEELTPGRVPYSIKGILTHDLVDKARPGDRVKITGIFKTFVNENSRGRKSTLFTPYLKILSIEGRNAEDEELNISPEDEKEFRRLAAKPNIQDLIAKSIAPSILGMEHLKMAAALSLFGGVRKEMKDGSARRGDIHILFVGDPGTGKSIHGAEKVYIGYPTQNSLQWNCEAIGDFVDNLMNKNKVSIISNDDTEILKLDKNSRFHTASIDPNTLKTKRTKILELSRHNSNNLIKITTKSGRKILTTPDHSFSTILNGRLEVLTGDQLNENSYLPVARKLDLNGFQQIDFADMSENIPEGDLVSIETIRLQNSLIESNQISKMEAYENANITHGTFKKYSEELDTLPEGDWIRTKYDTSWFPRKIELTKEFGRIIGFYLAEGNSEKTTIRITNTDEDIVNIIYEDFQKIFQKATIIKNGCILCQSTVHQWFKHNFGTGAVNKKLPFTFITTPKEFRKGILSAYFSGDGWIEEKSATVNALTKSEDLATSLLDLLASFGIFASVHVKEIKKGQYKGNHYYQITITSSELFKFANLIGFTSSKKQKDLEKFVETWVNRKHYQSNDMIPNFGTLIKDVVNDLELVGKRGSWERSFKGELRGKSQRQRVGRMYLQNKVQTLKELYDINYKKYTDELNRLEYLANSDIFWDKIATIEPVKGNFKVYDIGTTDGHFIVANGNLIVHNSQILKQCAHISPQAIYTSGKGSSAAGLTAAVVRENDAAGLSLEAGALVLADGGNAIIDEFDKMDNRDRVAIHEAMEQQTVSVAKAGIIATLRARTSIIAAANPKMGRYSIHDTPTENINLSPPILSRFDLIFVVRDEPNATFDNEMADFILDLNTTGGMVDTGTTSDPLIPGETLQKYIKYARNKFSPKLSPEARKVIKDFYVDLRKINQNDKNSAVAVVARNLEGYIRIAEAYAKMALRNVITKEDAEKARKLANKSLEDTSIDPITGKLDADRILTGISTASRQINSYLDAIKKKIDANGGKPIDEEEFITDFEFSNEIERSKIEAFLAKLKEEGAILSPTQGKIIITPDSKSKKK
ncbi:MAG: hypothetical protein EU530_02025 [Promethearchaeota archaeon]|nr:MAG: hypothetical protein EU530_02025 [Candidatus Lokiarchaeota archaeon]